MGDDTPDIITKSPANLCAGIAQQAANIVGDMISAYWSASEGKTMPTAFIRQAEERVKHISLMLTALKKPTDKPADIYKPRRPF